MDGDLGVFGRLMDGEDPSQDDHEEVKCPFLRSHGFHCNLFLVSTFVFVFDVLVFVFLWRQLI